MLYASKKLRETVANLPTSPIDLAPDQYEWYTPSWGDYVGAAINRQARWVAKGSYSVKGLSTTEDSGKPQDAEINKLVKEALDKHEN